MIQGIQMKLLLRVVVHLLFVFGLLVFLAMPSNKYSWMQEMDPLISVTSVDDVSGNRSIFKILLLIVMVATQLAIAVKTANKREKLVSIVLVLVAISVWLLR